MIIIGSEQGFQKNDGRHTADRAVTDQQRFQPVFKGQQAIPTVFKVQQLPPAFMGMRARSPQN